MYTIGNWWEWRDRNMAMRGAATMAKRIKHPIYLYKGKELFAIWNSD